MHWLGIVRLPTTEGQNASSRRCRSRSTRAIHNSGRSMWGQKALRRRRPRPSWSAPTENRLTGRVRRKTDDRLPAERHSESSAIVTGNCRRQPLCRTKDILCAELYFTINRQGERLITTMDSDSDEPLSTLASMDYRRTEIAKIKKLVAMKTIRVHPSATSPAAAGRRLLPRILTTGVPDSPTAATPSSSVGPRGL